MNIEGEEADRVSKVYAQRRASGVDKLYQPNRAEIVYERAVVDLVIASYLAKFGLLALIQDIQILDAGCGRGRQLRLFAEWGATAQNLHGIDVFESDVADAVRYSPSGVDIRVGSAQALPYADDSFDVINVNTVLSSILCDQIRAQVCGEIVRVLKPGGVLFVYDFVFRNPKNQNVRNVTRGEIRKLFGDCLVETRRLTMAPPISRRIGRIGMRFLAVVDMFIPFLRTHRMFIIRKA